MSSAEYQRRWRASKGARTGQPGRPVTRPCGTVAAYKRHQTLRVYSHALEARDGDAGRMMGDLLRPEEDE